MTPDPPAEPGTSDQALAAALAGDGELVTLEELAARSGLSHALLQAVARAGFLVARTEDPPRYAVTDLAAVRAGLTLVDAGLPLGELFDLARRTDEAMRPIAEHAVALFVEFIRDPVLGTATDAEEATERLLQAYGTMLPATEQLVGLHFRELLLAAARELWERETGGS